MTVDAAGGRTGTTRKTPAKRAKPRPAVVVPPPLPPPLPQSQPHSLPHSLAPLIIGEPDRNIFNCPVCSRPLVVGAARCPNCKTRLILGTPMKRVTIFSFVGVLLGIVLSWGVSTGLAATQGLGRPAPSASASARASAATVASPLPTGPVGDLIPPISRSALGQTGVLDNRLAEGAAALRNALKEKDLDSAAVADILRSLAADASFGEGLAPRLGTWDQATEVSVALGAIYTSVRGTAVDGLNASIQNDPAYRAAAQRMLVVMSGIAPLDAEVRTLASVAGVDMPPPISGAASTAP
ncbi:MAG TPA: hypothetical protein VGC90_05970 [Candidatus Limnocylindrales bacterium]